MRYSLFIFVLLMMVNISYGQNIGIGTSSPNSKAILEITSTDKGLLIPRLTTVQMNGITTPPTGLCVYNTDSTAFAYYNGSQWLYLRGNGTAINDWGIKGNSGTDASSHFLGTKDNKPLKFRVNNVPWGNIDPVTKNVGFGENALKDNDSGARNVALGITSMQNNLFGQDNVAIGSYSLLSNTAGIRNVAIGHKASYAVNANYTIAIGNAALHNNTKAEVIAIGDSTLYNNGIGGTTSQGILNIALGNKVMQTNTLGSFNIGIGNLALKANSTGNNNTAIGLNTLRNNNIGVQNIAIGNNSQLNTTDGGNNIAVGYDALRTNNQGSNNVGIGSSALYGNTAGIGNIGIGLDAGRLNTQGDHNVSVGIEALRTNASGNSNVAIGVKALRNSTTQSNNVAVGDSSLFLNGQGATLNDQGISNTAVGSKALADNTTGSYNTAFGFNALRKNSSSNVNVAVGAAALFENTLGSGNIAVGTSALHDNTNGDYNTAIGEKALNGNVGGDENTSVGGLSLFNNVSGFSNTAIGFNAQFFADGTNGRNVSVGHSALLGSYGFDNVGIGANSMNSVFGNKNTGLGSAAGTTTINGSNNTFLGSDTDIAGVVIHNSTAIGSKAYISQSNTITLGSINGVNGATVDTKVGIGTVVPDEKLTIGSGRLKFRTGIGTGLGHGIVWTNSVGNIDKSFFGMESDDFLSIGNTVGYNVRFHNTSGEVGINKQPLTSSNDSKLQVKQSGLQNGIGIEAASTSNHWDFYVSQSMSLYYNGGQKGVFDNISGNYTPVSDKRMKKDISPMTTASEGLLQLMPYKYHYLDNAPNDRYSVGFMAQDVLTFFPEAVVENKNKDGEIFYTLNYQALSVLAIKVLQEEHKEIAALKEEIKAIKAMLEKKQ